MIPTHADQPTNSFYNASKPATYAPEHDTPSEYPARLDAGVSGRLGPDRRRAEERVRHGRHLRHALAPGRRQRLRLRQRARQVRGGPDRTPARPTSTPSSAARRSRSGRPSRTRPATTSSYGGTNGYLDLFTGDASYAKQWKFTNAPDADARAVQAAYWADVWAKEQGKGSRRLGDRRQGRQDGRLPALLHVRQVLQEGRQLCRPDGLPRRHRQGQRALPAVLVLRLGRRDRHLGRLGLAHRLQPHARRLPEPAGRLRAELVRRPEAQVGDRTGGLGHVAWTGSWSSTAGSSPTRVPSPAARPTAGRAATRARRPARRPSTACTTTRSPSTTTRRPTSGSASRRGPWSGSPSTTSRRVTRAAEAVLDKWVDWALSKTTINPDGTYRIPSTLQWSGQPDTWNAVKSGRERGTSRHRRRLHQRRRAWPAAYAKTLTYYAARSGDTEAGDTAKALLDGMWSQLPGRRWASPSRRPARTTTGSTTRCTSRPAGRATMPNGDTIEPASTFASIRSFYEDDPNWPKVEAYLARRRRARLHLPPVLGPGGHRTGHGFVRGAPRIAPQRPRT